MSRGESPGYPLGDAPEDGGIETFGWVPTDWAETPNMAPAWFRAHWPEALEGLDENGFDLVPTGDRVWMRQSPCLVCEGTGAGPRPRLDGRWMGPVVCGPREACESCDGDGEQHEGGDYIAWQNCGADDEGAVEFWQLEAVERESAVGS